MLLSPMFRPVISFRPGALEALQQHAVATAPSPAVAKSIVGLPPEVLLHLANTGAQAAGAAAQQIAASSGSSALGTGVVPVDGSIGDANELRKLWAMSQRIDPAPELKRKTYPSVPFPADMTTDGTGSGTFKFVPDEDVLVYRICIPSGQGFPATAVVNDIIANGRLVNVESDQGSPVNAFSERSKGGRVGIGFVKAGTPITVEITGATAATTYHAVLQCYGLQAPKETDPTPPDFMGILPLGMTNIAANGTGTAKATPVCRFRPRLIVLDDSQAQFGTILLTSLTSGVLVEEAASGASIPAAFYSTLAEDDFEDFNAVPRNTPMSLGYKNTSATTAAVLAGHILGECWVNL